MFSDRIVTLTELSRGRDLCTVVCINEHMPTEDKVYYETGQCNGVDNCEEMRVEYFCGFISVT